MTGPNGTCPLLDTSVKSNKSLFLRVHRGPVPPLESRSVLHSERTFKMQPCLRRLVFQASCHPFQDIWEKAFRKPAYESPY